MDRVYSPEWQGLPEVGTGQLAAIGRLYNAPDEKVLYSSIISNSDLPAKSITASDAGGVRYRHTETDSLGERLSNLNISAEMGIKVLCGMSGAGWCADYLSRKTANKRVRHASTICISPTKTETLNLESDDLKPFLNLKALELDEATHIIWGIQWGARTLVTVREVATNGDNSWNAKGVAGNNPSHTRDTSDTTIQPSNENILSRFAKYIGETHIEAKAAKDDKNNSLSTDFLFDIVADVANLEQNRIGADFASVKEFLQGVPRALEKVNGGKGVPIAISLMPIGEVAKIFKVSIQYSRAVARIEQPALQNAIKILEKYETTTQSMDDYASLVQNHTHCVPKSHIKRANTELGNAQNTETKFRTKLARTITEVRLGKANMADLWKLLHDDGSSDSDNTSSDPDDRYNHFSVGEYADKISFADAVMHAGAHYIDPKRLDNYIVDNRTCDMYILHLSRKAQCEKSWNEHRRTLLDLLDAQDAQYRVVVVDYDVKNSKGTELDKAYIEQYRNGKAIVTDVTESRKQLAQMCQLQCDDAGAVDRTRSHDEPSGRRIVRVPCPGENCWETGPCEWICPTCRNLVYYGFTDDYLYCRCSRFLFQHASFKCNGDKHGANFVKYGEKELQERLKRLDASEEYTILVLGSSGVGKTMFINALFNYFEFESMQDAMADNGPLQYIIPFSFRYCDKDGTEREVKVGKPTIWERISMLGQSSTRKTVTYCFDVGGKIIRFIDTPGINDTDGIGQDYSNIEDIFEMLQAIKKLNGILILIPPGEERLDTAFRFCISELLSRLHRDTRKNVLFGFTKAESINFRPGPTSSLLDTMLDDFKTGIARGPQNQYFFDSEGFMFLAVSKQKLPEKDRGVEHHAKLWARSAGQVHQLIKTVMGLPSHDVSMTLKLQRTEVFFEGIAKVLAEFTTVSKKAEKKLQDSEYELKEVIGRGENLAEKAKAKITVTIRSRRELPKEQRRTVCCHDSCTEIFHDEEGNAQTNYKTICHYNCDLDAGDGLPGAYNLQYCNPFRRLMWISCGNTCCRDGCKHDWKVHQHISHEWSDEEKEIEDENVMKEIKSNEDAKDELNRKIRFIRENQENSRKERLQIQAARAMFFVYLSQNAVGTTRTYDDATITYLDYSIAVARREGKIDVAEELGAQKAEHQAAKDALKGDIDAGTVTKPNDADIDEKIEGLVSMALLGPELKKMIGSRSIEVDKSRFIYVKRREKEKKGRWWKSGS